MKKRLMGAFLLLLVFSVSVVLADSCIDSQEVMALYGDSGSEVTNTHGELWNGAGTYQHQICYDEIFGDTYGGSSPHACDMRYNDDILYLYSTTNSHASLISDVNGDGTDDYTNSVCYGNLRCQEVSGECPDNTYSVVKLYNNVNSHLASSDNAYTINVCCANMYWEDMAGNMITEADVGDVVRLVAPSGLSGDFAVKEKDYGLDADDSVITLSDTNTDGYRYYVEWTIGEDELEASGTDDYDEFYFRVDGETSPFLEINTQSSNSPTIVEIASPTCGSYFDVDSSDSVYVYVAVEDADDIIDGTVTIIDSETEEELLSEAFSNTNDYLNSEGYFVPSFDLKNQGEGEYRIEVYAVAERASRGEVMTTSNIIVYDTEITKDYTAACIAEPTNLISYDEDYVRFNASTTRGVKTTGTTGYYELLIPGEDAFVWNWDFTLSESGEVVGRDLDTNCADGDMTCYTSQDWYYFQIHYLKPGYKTVTLSVDLP